MKNQKKRDQYTHMKQLFQLGKQIGWLNKNITAEHIAFGIISDTNGKISSRIGDTLKLLDLIEDGINETTKTFSAKSEYSDPDTIKKMAIGSIKYFDLTKVRTTQYVLPKNLDYNKLVIADFNILRKISELPTILTKVEKTKMPHYLCDYLNNLSTLLHYGYHNTRCLEFDKENKIISFNESRIVLYMFVHHVLKTGCKLLGMHVVDKM
jgi:arginyl-tRNA synthetase